MPCAGNSETDDRDDGCGTMEAIYFGNAHWHGNTGAGGTGPWVGADLEQGMYYGGGNVTKNNPQSQALPHEFVTLYLRGQSITHPSKWLASKIWIRDGFCSQHLWRRIQIL